MSAQLRLLGRADVGAGLTCVTLSAPPEMHAHYTRPGQVLQVRIGSDESFFALASPVGAPSWELLVRDAGSVARALLTEPLGAEISAQLTELAGFPYQDGAPGPFTLVAVGSALGAVRGLLLALESAGRCQEVRLFLGVQDPARVPLVAELARLAAAGARVTLCFSDAPAAPDPALPFEHHAGLVQGALERALADGSLRAGAIYVAGPQSMMDELRAREAAFGLRVHANA